MEGVRKLARSGSVRVEEMLSSKKRQNGKEEVEENDTHINMLGQIQNNNTTIHS